MKITIESPSAFEHPNITIPISKVRTLAAFRSDVVSEIVSGMLGGPVGAAASRIVADKLSHLKGPMTGNLDVKLTFETQTRDLPIAFEINLRIEGDPR